jgi:hypothetical protein
MEECCRDLAHTMELKVCKVCYNPVSLDYGCKLCEGCVKALNQCGHCLGKLEHGSCTREAY